MSSNLKSKLLRADHWVAQIIPPLRGAVSLKKGCERLKSVMQFVAGPRQWMSRLWRYLHDSVASHAFLIPGRTLPTEQTKRSTWILLHRTTWKTPRRCSRAEQRSPPASKLLATVSTTANLNDDGLHLRVVLNLFWSMDHLFKKNIWWTTLPCWLLMNN